MDTHSIKYTSPFSEAKNQIDKLFCLVSDTYNDIIYLDLKDIKLEKDKWLAIPENLGRKIHATALTETENTSSLIAYYEPYGFMKPHNHAYYETIKVLEGSLIDKITDKVYNQGDIVIFDKGQKHHMCNNTSSPTYVYAKLSNSLEDVKIDEPITLYKYKTNE